MDYAINKPAIVAELTEMYGRYEAALMADDTDTLNAIFWDSPQTIRYSVTSNQVGHDQIRADRAASSAQGGAVKRDILRMVVTTYGDDYGTVNIEYLRPSTGRYGRQSQTWLRFPDGWHVVAAHVSLLPKE